MYDPSGCTFTVYARTPYCHLPLTKLSKISLLFCYALCFRHTVKLRIPPKNRKTVELSHRSPCPLPTVSRLIFSKLVLFNKVLRTINLFEASFSAHESNSFLPYIRFQASFKVRFIGIWKHTAITKTLTLGFWKNLVPIRRLAPFLHSVISSKMNMILWELTCCCLTNLQTFEKEPTAYTFMA
jgi:hypothetical protein